MARIWRIAKPDRNYSGRIIGPYCHSDRVEVDGQSIGSAHWDSAHPSPGAEGIPENNWGSMGRVCGLVSEEHMIRWFEKPWMRVMHALGFMAYVYEVPEGEYSIARNSQTGQVTFCYEQYELVGMHSLRKWAA